jgi:hypothetical protein
MMKRQPPQHRPIPPRQRVVWNAPRPREERVLAKLREACMTGGYCSLLYGPEEPAAISPRGLRLLTAYGIWPQAMRAIVEIGNVHPRAQRRFLQSWVDCDGYAVRALTGDDELYFRALRVIMPPYCGPARVLYRGQLAGMWTGVSWSTNFMVAQGYGFSGVYDHWTPELVERAAKALLACPFRTPPHLMLRPLPNRRPIILKAKMRGEILAKLPERRGDFRHDEYLCDPRNVSFEVFEAADLPDPRL